MSEEAELLKGLLDRRQIRRDLESWARYCGYVPAPHHRLVLNALERVSAGTLPRVAIFMPPGSAKSTYTSVLFTPWFLANHPQACIIAASHTQELAENWGRRVRNLVTEHGNVLGVDLSTDSQAAGRWETAAGGQYFAAGVGGAVTGRRADLALIDDPVRSREDADSEVIREKTWEWYRSDLRTRMKPGGRIILIQTRWHEDDLAGRILAEMAAGKEQWEVINLPAEAEGNDPLGRQPGEWLWDDAYGYANFLKHEKATQSTRNWSALYQQRPTPEEGDYFKAEWLKTYSKLPPKSEMAIYGASDYAVTSDGGDYTVHVVVGVDPEGRMYLLDLWRKQASSDVWVDSLISLVKEYKPREWAEEQGQIKAGIGPFLERQMRAERAYVYRRTFPTRGDKAVRAQSIRGRMAMDGLFVPTWASWYHELKSELLSFPAGKHDDIVDALGLVGQLLDYMQVGTARHPAKQKIDTGYKPYEPETQIDDWKTY